MSGRSRLSLPSLDRLSALPSDVLGALRMLPEIAENTRKMATYTAALPEVAEALRQVSADTQTLVAMDRRLASIEEAMPVLVEVQRHLAQLPETMGSLDDGIERLTVLMEKIVTALGELESSVETLRGAVEPMSRLANRVPGQRKAERDEQG
jgi:phage-related minor tail protein